MFHHNRIHTIVLSMLLFLPVIACSEDVNLDKIVVTPSKMSQISNDSSQTVDVIGSKEIELQGTEQLSDVLTDITSANISNYGGPGGTQHLRMRGSTSAQVLIMVDGLPINNPRDGEADLSTIPVDNIDRIEVVHGPASSAYGSSAMGGAVNIITKNPPGEGKKIEAITKFGTYRTYLEQISAGGRLGPLGCIITAGYESSAGFRTNTEFNSKNANAKFNYDLNSWNSLKLNSSFFKSKAGTPGPITSPDPDDKQTTLNNTTDIKWDFNPDQTTSISSRFYNIYDRLQFNENETESFFDTAGIATHTTKVTGGEIQLNKKFASIYEAVLGVNYVSNTNNSTSSGKHKYSVNAGYIENKLNLLEQLTLNLNGRVDDYSNFGTQFNPSAGIVYKINELNRLRGSIGRSFRAPTFNDLYWPDEGWAKGNPNLKPEKGITYEIGYDTDINKYISGGITYYRNVYSNLINWAEVSDVWTPLNVDSAIIDGIELENTLSFTDNFSINAKYTFLHALDKKTHKFLIYQPENKIDCALKYKFPHNLLVEIKGQFTGTRYADTQNSSKVKSFYTMGINVSKKIGNNFTYLLSINNMLNKKYQVMQDYPMPGFSITGGIKAEF